MLAWNVASANVDCSTPPYGESVAQYGRDEFRLGIIAMMHNDDRPLVPQSMMREVDKEMRAACLAKFYGQNLPRYSRLGLSPHSLRKQSVGSIAAVGLSWNRPYHRGSARVPSASSTASGTAAGPALTKRPTDSGKKQSSSFHSGNNLLKVTSNVPACPYKEDIKMLLSAALIDEASWPKAAAVGKRHGCIELRAGERVYRVRSDKWAGLIRVRPEGRAKAYWTDTLMVK